MRTDYFLLSVEGFVQEKCLDINLKIVKEKVKLKMRYHNHQLQPLPRFDTITIF
jgi:hypothetical protein